MKKILFIASAILILLSGCENFLDSELLTEKTTANFPETEKDAQEMVTAIYAHLLFESPETSSQYYMPSWQVTTVWEATSPTPTTVPPTSLCTVAI